MFRFAFVDYHVGFPKECSLFLSCKTQCTDPDKKNNLFKPRVYSCREIVKVREISFCLAYLFYRSGKFFFDASNIEHKRANEKRDVIFSFRNIAQDDTLVFDSEYSVRGRVTKIEEILRDLRAEDISLSDETTVVMRGFLFCLMNSLIIWSAV